MRLVFCDNSLRELLNFRGDVISHFLNRGDEVVLVAPRNIEGHPLLERCGVVDVALERSGMNPLKDLGYMLNLWRLYRRLEPDHVFHYTIKPNVYGCLAARLSGVKATAMVTGLGYAFNHDDLRSRAARMLYRLGLMCADHVFVLNGDNLRVLLDKKMVRADKVILLSGGEGIDVDMFK